MAYEVLAQVYDRFTRDVDYRDICTFVTKNLRDHGIEGGIVLDLACGTGTLSYLLAEEGYEVVGADLSEDMLAVATMKRGDCGAAVPPVFIRQDMRRLDLYGTINACVCTLDAVSHLIGEGELDEVFRRISLFTEVGGLLIFDINSADKLVGMDGHTFVEQDKDFYCAWSVARENRTNTYGFYVDLFRRQGNLWRREQEQFAQRAYTVDDIQASLKRAGFSSVGLFGGYRGQSPDAAGRLIFIAEKC